MKLRNKKSAISSFALMWISLSLAVLTAACNDPGCMTADVITPIHEAEASAKGYKLVVITTGMQDKVEAVTLFPKNVTFDICGKPNAEAYDMFVLEGDKKLAKIVVQDNKIDLQYSNLTGTTDFQTVQVEFK